VQAQVALGNYDEAVAAMEKLTALDPKRDRTQLDMLRFRQIQGLIENGRKARQAKRLDEADSIFSRALALSPQSTIILRELAATEIALGTAHRSRSPRAARGVARCQRCGSACDGWRRPGSAEPAAGGRRGLRRAAALDDRWKSKAESLKAAANTTAVPEGLRDIAAAPTVTRAQLAGLIGTRLNDLVTRAPRRAPAIVTDVEGHWAAAWIVPVAQTGIMEVFSNHTFQPGATVRRGELAQAVSQLLPLALAGRVAQLTQWQAARPAFPDVAVANLYYRAAALAVTAGIMTVDEPDGSFRHGPRRAAKRRRPSAESSNWRSADHGHLTAANQLTMLRLLLVPVFALCMIYGRTGWALVVFACGALTDALDGLIARRTGTSTLGAWLDPMADKLLLATMFVMLTLPGLGLVARIPCGSPCS
jgi:hypothetical protein